jgi:peptidyl-prolyl cis-trans isomerase A (cyclophilin A)
LRKTGNHHQPEVCGMLKNTLSLCGAVLIIAVCAAGVSAEAPAAPASPRPVVVLETSLGDITIELAPDKAPETVKNFLQYIDDGFYDGTLFHRVIPNFMIQGGGFTAGMQQKPTRTPITNEADNGLRNARGAIAMARTHVRDSATSQFFINLKDNQALDHGVRDYGYAVFGTVTTGMNVVDAIAAVPTGIVQSHQNVPLKPVMLKKAYRKK